MIKLTIIDPEGGEAKQKSQRIKDPHQKNISLRLEANRTEDNKGMDLYWSAHFSKRHSKDKDKGKDKSNDKDTCNYSVETTIVHPTDTSKNITQKRDYTFTQKHNIHKITDFLVFSTLKEGGFFTSENPPTICVTGSISIIPSEKRAKSPVPIPSPACALKVPTNELGVSVVMSPSGSPASNMLNEDDEGGIITRDKGDDGFNTENVTPPTKAEKPFEPLLKIEGFKGVEKDKVIYSEPQKLLDKYTWKLMVKFSESDISVFVEVCCKDEKWELKADVSIYVINESKKYESLDFNFIKTFKNSNNVKGYKSLLSRTKLESEGFLSETGSLSLHCTVASYSNISESAPFKMFKFQCPSATELEIDGFTSQEQGILYTRWTALEGLGRWRGFCSPRGRATFRDFVSCGFQVEPSAELANSGAQWSATFSGHIEITRGIKGDTSPKTAKMDGVTDFSTSFTNVRTCVSINEFVPVETVLKKENGFLSDDGNDTIKIVFILRPLNAINPNKIISKKAAMLAKDRLSESLKKLNDALDTFFKSSAPISESKAKAIARFQSLSLNVVKYAEAYSSASKITERYAKLEEEIKTLEARENALLGKGGSEDTQKLLETIGATSKLLNERLEDAPDTASKTEVSSPGEEDDTDKEVVLPDGNIPGNKSTSASFTEAWDATIIAGYRVVRALTDCGIALDEVCMLNDIMRTEYSKMADLANEKKKEIDKMGPYRQSIWEKWAKLKRTVDVLEGNKDVIDTLSRTEAEKFIEMAEEAQENFKVAGMK